MEPGRGPSDNGTPPVDAETWAELDPTMRFAIRVAVILFCCGVIAACVAAMAALLA